MKQLLQVFRPSPVQEPNPLRTGKLRNTLCICASGIKTKKCCGKDLYVTKALAKDIKLLLDKRETLFH